MCACLCCLFACVSRLCNDVYCAFVQHLLCVGARFPCFAHVHTVHVQMISPVYNKGPMASVVAPVMVPQTYTQAGAIAGAAAAMQQIRAAQLQRAKVAGYLLKPMYTTP
jgi:hypothetical protein